MQSNCSVYPCISLLLSGHVENSPVLSGLMLPLCRSFLSNSSEAESLSTERIPNQIPFYSCLPELLTRNHTALQHTNICPHPSLPFLSLSVSFLSQLPLLPPKSTAHSHPTLHLSLSLSHPPFLQSIRSTVFSLNKKSRTVERIPPVQVSVMCCDERTWRQRGLLIMKHTGPKLQQQQQHWEETQGKREMTD